jgi:hypothetical protein
MKYSSMKWLWCYVAILTIGTTQAHSAREMFIRGLLGAGIVVTAIPTMITDFDHALMCNLVVFIGSCADFCMAPHPTRAGVAASTGGVLATMFLIAKLEREKRRVAEESLKSELRY